MGGNSRPAALIGVDHAAFMQGGVSVIVASRNPARVPDVVRGCGCKVSRDRRHVTVLVEPGRASELLEDIRLTGTIAVVFSQPSTHRTIQLKGTDAHVVPVTPADRRIAGRHLGDWVEELVSVGYSAEFAAAVRGRAEMGLTAITFTPTSAFEQTPGSRGRHAAEGKRVTVTLDAIRPCLEGAVPAVIATCARDGTPNVSYISEVHYVDTDHVALSFQFFSKTRQNVLENPRATVVVIHPDNAAQYKLAVHYLRTEESGALFESMKAKLAGIASHTGMTGVFKLRGADVYRVESIVQVYGTPMTAHLPRLDALSAVRSGVARLAGASDLASLLDGALAVMREQFRFSHAMVLMHDPVVGKLYAVASAGYPQSGVGAEIALGEGVIGVAAQERTPIRISHATAEFGYGRAVRDAAESHGMGARLVHEIPFPGLTDSQSQIAVPILAGDRLIGVLFAESVDPGRYGYDEEDALVVLATHIGLTAQSCDGAAEATDEADLPASRVAPPKGRSLKIRRFAENDSIFVDGDYLIKGVAGAIFWRLVRGFVDERRTDYSNRELRLDPRIHLPDVSENLEARLILLQRRLEERCPSLQIEKTGRGRFRLNVLRPLELSDMQSGAPERPGLQRPN